MEKYRILCVSDHIDPIVYSDSIKTRYQGVNFIVSCGDLPLHYYDFITSSLNKPLFFIFGNHNLRRIGLYVKKYQRQVFSDMPGIRGLRDTQYPGGTYIGGKVCRYKNVLLAGLGGSLWYNGGPNQFTEKGMMINIIKLIPRLLWNRLIHGRYLDVLVTHSPPAGIHDRPDRCHTGFKVFLWFLRKFKPRLHIHGHVHIYNINNQRESRFLNTRIINAYDHTVVELEV